MPPNRPSTPCGEVFGAEEADQHRAEDAADEVDADDVERVVEADLVLQADRDGADHAGDARR